MAKKQDTKAEVEVEEFEIYEDEDGNEFILVDGEFVPFNSDEYELAEGGEDEAQEVEETEEEDVEVAEETDEANEEAEEEVFEVYEDEEGEYILVDGERVPFDPSEYEEVEVEKEATADEIDEDDKLYNPFMYDNVQAATDVANDIARSGAGIAREGAALASEMKEAMDDIKSMLDVKSWLE